MLCRSPIKIAILGRVIGSLRAPTQNSNSVQHLESWTVALVPACTIYAHPSSQLSVL